MKLKCSEYASYTVEQYLEYHKIVCVCLCLCGSGFSSLDFDFVFEVHLIILCIL